MKSFFKKNKEKKESKTEVSGLLHENSAQVPEVKDEVKNEATPELSWLEIMRGFKEISTSPALKVKIYKLKKKWKPLIKDLEKMIETVKDEHMDLVEQDQESKSLSSSNDSIQEFLAIAKRMLEKVKSIDDELISFELYIVNTEEEANAVRAENAIILYPSQTKGYSALVITKDPHVYHGIPYTKQIISKVSTDIIKKLPELMSRRNDHKEVMLTEDNLKAVQKIIKTLASEVGISIKNKQLLGEALSLVRDIPAILDAFEKLPFADALRNRMNEFQTQAGGLDFNKLIKMVLPIDTYETLRAQVFEMLDPDEFSKLSIDKQAAALALIESYNTAIKLAVLSMDKMEIQYGLVPGALTTKIGIVKGMSIKVLCTEFNDVYQKAMVAAGFDIHAELYPYDFSILEQRKAMLESLDNDPESSKKKQQKELIERRIRMMGEVKPLPRREDITDFYHFIKDIAGRNVKRAETLKAQFVTEEKTKEEKVKMNSVNLTQSAKSFISNAETALKEALDEEVYQTYFTQTVIADKNSPWIQQAGNAFQHVKEMVTKLETLQAQSDKKSPTPMGHLMNRGNEIDEILDVGTQLITELSQLQKDLYLRKIISMQFVDGMEQVTELKKQAQLAKIEAKSMLDEIKASAFPLREVVIKLKSTILNKASGTMPIEKALQAIDKASALAVQLDALYKDMEGDLDRKPNMLMFAVNHFSELFSLMKTLPDLLETLKELPKEDLINIIEQTNNALKEIVLLADKLEIQMCLKNGYIRHRFAPFMRKYYDTINELGYDFSSENDRYPFMNSLIQQRQALLKGAPDFQKKLIEDRINHDSSHAELKADAYSKAIDPLFYKDQSTIMEQMIRIISEYVDKIEKSEVSNKDVDKDRENSITLFNQLKTILQEHEREVAIHMDTLLKKVHQNNPDHFHLLYEGRNASIIKKLEYISAMPEDILKAFDIELARLKKQRGEVHFLKNKEKAALLELKINACEQLKDLIGRHNLNDAIKKLTSTQEKAIDTHFINHLRMIENALPAKAKPMTLIGASKFTPKVVAENVDAKTDEHQSAIRVIEERLQDLQTSISQSEIVKSKIILVTMLKNSLKSGLPLDASLDAIYGSAHAKNAYLLFEGRTGKAIKSAQNMTITKAELINRLDADIQALKKQRYSHLYVFANTRKEKGDQHIEILKELKSIINHPDNKSKSIKEIIGSLEPAKIKVLKHYEPDFLKDLNKISPTVRRAA